jgi:hypothetical protein
MPNERNGPRFQAFVKDYFPAPLNTQSDTLWSFRNAAVHGFSPGPYKVTHHHSNVHLTTDGGLTVLNAEDFYAAFVLATRKYFDGQRQEPVSRTESSGCCVSRKPILQSKVMGLDFGSAELKVVVLLEQHRRLAGSTV